MGVSCYLLCIYPITLMGILLFHAQASGKGLFREEFWTRDDSKAIQSVATMFIILHHLTQSITDYGAVDKGPITIFALVGILFTAVFFFFSGYGLVISLHTKPDYLDGFIKKRIMSILIPFMLTNIIYTFTIGVDSERIGDALDVFTSILGITLINTNAWFIVEILILYLAFYLSFKHIKKENTSFGVMAIVVVFMVIASLLLGHDNTRVNGHWFQGEWWYNTTVMFFIGMLVARYKNQVASFLKKNYKWLFPVSLIAFLILLMLSIAVVELVGYYQEWEGHAGYAQKAVSLMSQLPVCIIFILILLLISMKFRFGNGVLLFLEKISLELYLVHDIFRMYFSAVFSFPDVVFFILVFVCSILLAFGLSKIHQLLFERWIAYTEITNYAILMDEARVRAFALRRNIKMIRTAYVLCILATIVLTGVKWYRNYILPVVNYNEEIEMLPNVQIGDQILFGTYETDYSESGKERISWRVVDIQDDKVLLVSQQGLTGYYYHANHIDTNWYNSTIRRMLNKEFYEEAFCKQERELIVQNEELGDKVFLLSVEEALRYFEDDEDRLLEATPNAFIEGINQNSRNLCSWWWLRDTGDEANKAAVVTMFGEIDQSGEYVNIVSGGVRPAVWVDIQK
ncbi:MAG: acyltransferase [Lachnospiraceae bacterium]|nr:acyltransferase [Lachnospiraceae bacterium]